LQSEFKMIFDVFVSYSNKDKAIADTVVASLEEKNLRCWYAPRDIQPSEDWGEAISNAIEHCKIFLIIFSGSANRSRHVLDELILAIDEEVTVLPFRVENLAPIGSMRLHLSSRHWLDAYDPSWKEYIQKLVQTVCANLNIPLEDISEQKSVLKEQDLQKATKKKFPKLLTITGIGTIVIAAAWFGWTRLFGEQVNDQEVDVIPTKDLNELSPQGVLDEECRIVYVSHLDENNSLSLMKPDGSDQTPITNDVSDDIFPKWSFDGKKIAFISNRNNPENEHHEIYVIDDDGKNLTRFNNESNDSEYYNQFTWSPVSDQIAYVSEERGNADIFIGEIGRSVAITSDPSNDSYPAWSPDGSRIAFVSEREGNKDIFLVDTDGENLIQLTTNSANDKEPAWSPNGKRIAFASDRSGKFNIYTMNADGSLLIQRTKLGNNRYPNWSRDENMITFYSDRSGRDEIHIIDLFGSLKRLVASEKSGFLYDHNRTYYSWSPDGSVITASEDGVIFLISLNNPRPYIHQCEKLAVGWYPVWSPNCYKLE